MSAWTHSMCPRCWNDRHPEKPTTIERDGRGAHERCCYCGWFHASGIYVRETPESADLVCREATLDGWTHNNVEPEDGV